MSIEAEGSSLSRFSAIVAGCIATVILVFKLLMVWVPDLGLLWLLFETTYSYPLSWMGPPFFEQFESGIISSEPFGCIAAIVFYSLIVIGVRYILSLVRAI